MLSPRCLVACVLFLLMATTAVAADRPWPFHPPVAGQPPKVENANWASNEIDAFVLEKLEQHGLKPAPKASRRTLIRRLYFDLWGLPPTPESIDRFIADKSPQAYEKLVDALLADPRYGEHWARFWLDLARYADTAGFEGDPDLPHAWRYRDYVIHAFNQDKPYNLFIKEQIAGDEFAEILGAGDLPGVPAENMVAMTFLRLAPFTEPRGDETRHEMLSEMTSTVGSVFLGLTVGCAKCHDHKYDAIPTKDFYRMMSFFATIQVPRPLPGDGFQIGGPLPAEFFRKGEKEWANKKRAQLQAEADTAQKKLAALTSELTAKLDLQSGFGMQAMGGALGNNYYFDMRGVTDGKPHHALVTAAGGKWTYFTDGRKARQLGTKAGENRGQWYGDLPSPNYISLGMYTNGSGQPSTAAHRGAFAELLIFDHALTEAERQSVDRYVAARNGGDAKAKLNVPGVRFWLDAADLDADSSTPNPNLKSPVARWVDKIGKIALEQSDAAKQPRLVGFAGGKRPAVEFDADFLKGSVEKASFLKDKSGTIVVVFTSTNSDEAYGFEVGGNGAFVSTFVNPAAAGAGALARILADKSDDRVTDEQRAQFQYLSSRGKFLPQHLKRLSPVAMSLRHSYGPPYEPGVPVSRVMIRGEWDNPGEEVKPGFLSVITGNQKPAPIRLDPFKRWPTRSRRMALANWIASRENPLTARVMVNRLWHRHFGTGIVSTPSDFGELSGGPSHRELLDWLAVKFVERKWSLKAVHRLICNSSTYRQRSRVKNARALEVDADNRLLWRFPLRRLDAESIRDNILSVSGRLNGEHYGLPIFPPLPDDIADRVKYTTSKWDTQHGPEGRRRSIYIYQQRTLNMPFLQTFDATVCDESRPRRRASVTPLQALAMMNGNLIAAETPHLAQRVIDEAGDDRQKRIERAFLIALGRPPGSDELQRMSRYYAKFDDPARAVRSVCRILLNSNEFVFID